MYEVLALCRKPKVPADWQVSLSDVTGSSATFVCCEWHLDLRTIKEEIATAEKS